MLSAVIIGVPIGVASSLLCSLVISRSLRTRTTIRGVRLACHCRLFQSRLREKLMLSPLAGKRLWNGKAFKSMKVNHNPGCVLSNAVGETTGEPEEWAIPLEEIYFNVLTKIKSRETDLGVPPWREHETWGIAMALDLDTDSEGDMHTLRIGLMKIVYSPYIFYSDIRFKKTGFPEMHDVHLTIEGEKFLNELSNRRRKINTLTRISQ